MCLEYSSVVLQLRLMARFVSFKAPACKIQRRPLVRKRTAVTWLKRAKSAISISDLKYKRCLVLAVSRRYSTSLCTFHTFSPPVDPHKVPQLRHHLVLFHKVSQPWKHTVLQTLKGSFFFFFSFFASAVIFMSWQHLKCVQLCACACV